MLPTDIARTRDHNESLVRCFGAFFLCISFQRGPGEVHCRVGAIRVHVVVSRVFTHLAGGSLTEDEGPESVCDLDIIISTQTIDS